MKMGSWGLLEYLIPELGGLDGSLLEVAALLPQVGRRDSGLGNRSGLGGRAHYTLLARRESEFVQGLHGQKIHS